MEHLHGLVAHGRRPGVSRLPTIARLAQECGVSIATAAKAVGILKQRGHIEASPRRGIFIVAPNTDRACACEESVSPPPSVIGFDNTFESFTHRLTSYSFKGAAAADAMLATVLGPAPETRAAGDRCVTMPGTVVHRSSTRRG